jgi:hypothetical protein
MWVMACATVKEEETEDYPAIWVKEMKEMLCSF